MFRVSMENLGSKVMGMRRGSRGRGVGWDSEPFREM